MNDSDQPPFTWEGRDAGTIGSLLDEASRAEREGKAVEFLRAYRDYTPNADANLGYIIGYLEPAQRRSEMYAAYDLMHPVFQGRP
jgi:hypothetical protein